MYPTLRQVVLDCTDARALAEFYRELLGLQYRPGDGPPSAGEPDPRGQDWLVLRDSSVARRWPFSRWRTCLSPVGRRVHARRCCTWT
jgi:hypothetical protein